MEETTTYMADGAFQEADGTGATGVVIRNHSGVFVAALLGRLIVRVH